MEIFRCFFTNEYIQKSKEEIKTLTQQTEVQPSTSTQSTKNAKPQKEETEDLPESADADIEIDSVSQYTRTVRSSHSYKLPSTLPMLMAFPMFMAYGLSRIGFSSSKILSTSLTYLTS